MRSSVRTRGMAVVLAVACVSGLTACGEAVEKNGAPSSHTTVLRLGAADRNNPQLLSFVSTVESSSHRRLRIQVDQRTYFSETPGGEAKLAEDLGTGKVDLGYLPSRDWAQAGAAGFAALQAPGLLTTTAQAVQLAQDPIAAQLLGGLSAKGVVGLGLIPDEARRLITRKPVLGAPDLRGERIRIGDNAQTAAMIAALGADAVQGLTARQTKGRLLTRELDGVETGPTPATQNTYNDPAPYLTSFSLIPKFEVLAANKAFWRKLPRGDQRLVQAAVIATVSRAAIDVPAREAHQLRLMCAGGLVIVRPSDDALASILAAAERARPTGSANVTLIGRIAAAVGATERRADAAPVPAGCAVAATATAAEQKHRSATRPVSSSPTANPALLVGTYKLVVTAADWAAAGVSGPDAEADIAFTWTLSPDGSMRETQKPDYPDQGPVSGTWQVRGGRIVFDFYDQESNRFHEVVKWSFFRGVLSLTPFEVQDEGSRVIYSVPWRKTA